MSRKKYKNLDAYRLEKQRENKRYQLIREKACNQRKRWEEYEILLVMKHEKTDAELAEELGRSVKAVQNVRRKVRLHEYPIAFSEEDDPLAALTTLYDRERVARKRKKKEEQENDNEYETRIADIGRDPFLCLSCDSWDNTGFCEG